MDRYGVPRIENGQQTPSIRGLCFKKNKNIYFRLPSFVSNNGFGTIYVLFLSRPKTNW